MPRNVATIANIAAVALAATFAGPAAAQAAAEEPAVIRERVDAYLGAIDRPIPASAWKALGADAVPILEEALRTDPLTPRRAAAAAGLAAIGGDAAAEALLEAARSDSEAWPVRSAAVRGLGVAMAPEQLSAALRPLMEKAGTAAVRGAAAEVLARRAPAASCAAIRAQLAREAQADRGFSSAAARCRAK